MAFEFLETMKESIIAYENLPLVTLVNLLCLGLALSYFVWLTFRCSPQPQHQRSIDYQEKVEEDMNGVTGASSPSWDVFLSFRGKDTRVGFISHLYQALDEAGIKTFIDDRELEMGGEISQELRNAIRNSKMFVVVISQNYADSAWCLNELVEILRWKTTKNLIPVFYYVDPSDLRHQKSCIGVALEAHKKRHSARIDKWKSALSRIADLSGIHLKIDANEREADKIKEIVEKVLSQASSKELDIDECLFAIDLAVEEVYQRLNMEFDDVCALGICGMGGIGKTTTAKAFYNKYSHKFGISCFLENVRQISHGGSPLLSFLQQLLIELLRGKDCKIDNVPSALKKLEKVLSSKKALVVLDDLDQSSYTKLLVRICKLFSHGSKVIITTRDANLPNQLKFEMSKVDTYFVKPLNPVDSLELFSYSAFKTPKPPLNYLKLSESFVTYVEGLPLALKVLGRILCSQDVPFWEDTLEKIRKIPMKDIEQILRLSYDELPDETVKAIFLDIIFFFIGKNKDEAVAVFKSCDLYPGAALPVLVDRCLLTIDRYNTFHMHSLIQAMGWNVIREESKNGKCQRLYLEQGTSQTLQNLEGFDKTEGLVVDLTKSPNKYCNTDIFEKFPNLKLLKLIDVHSIEGILKTSFCELRCISWHGCPWTHLPSTVHLPKLVSFDIQFSRFKTLWRHAELPSLRHLNLDGCKYLEELPESIGQLTKLEYLIVHHCVSLKRLPKTISQLSTLGCLDMSECENLKLLPEHLGDMTSLRMLKASFTEIEHLPDSIGELKNLVDLYLCGCKKLRTLPEQFGNMEGLTRFHAFESAIEQLPDSFSNLPNLVDLNLFDCRNLTSLPNSIWKLKSLQILNVACTQLKRLPELLGKMQCLEELQAYKSAIEELPDSIGLLPKIRSMNFRCIYKLTYVPHSILNLTSLENLQLDHNDMRRVELPDAVNNVKMEDLHLNCNIRIWLPIILSFSSLKRLTLIDECESFSPTEPFSFFRLFNLNELYLSNCKSLGSSFPQLPLNLKSLYVVEHASIEKVPDLSYLKQLNILTIRNCSSLQSLQKLPPHLSELDVCDCISLREFPEELPRYLFELEVSNCKSLQEFPDVSMLRILKKLVVTGNGRALKVILNESHLQVRGNKRFKAYLQNAEIPEWFGYRNSGNCVSFDIPSNLGDNFVGVSFWVVWKHLDVLPLPLVNDPGSHIGAYILNETEGKTYVYMYTNFLRAVGDVECFRGDDIFVKSGDRIHVLFKIFLHSKIEDLNKEVKMCGAHLILQAPLT